jgi:Spy/CpxP family protein refolding chaperone
MRRVVLLGLGLALAAPVAAQAQEGVPHAEGVHEHFFLPEVVMRHQRDLQLTQEQRETIKTAVTELQTSVVQLQWELVEANQQLIEIVEGQSVDERAAIQQLDVVLQIEGQVKRRQMRLLIQIKNTLTAEQQEQLDELLKAYQTGVGPPTRMEHMERGMPGHGMGVPHLEMRHIGVPHPGGWHPGPDHGAEHLTGG